MGDSKRFKNTNNTYAINQEYFDGEKKYVSELDMYFDMETDDTYTESINLKDGDEYSLKLLDNDLNQKADIEIKDSKSNVVIHKTLEAGEGNVDLSTEKLAGGKYTLSISLTGGCKGTLEIKIDE